MATTKLRQKGQVTIPAKMRDALGLQEDDILTVSSWNDKIIIVIPQKLKNQELLEKTARLAKKKNVSLEEMLLDLEEVRHKA